MYHPHLPKDWERWTGIGKDTKQNTSKTFCKIITKVSHNNPNQRRKYYNNTLLLKRFELLVTLEFWSVPRSPSSHMYITASSLQEVTGYLDPIWRNPWEDSCWRKNISVGNKKESWMYQFKGDLTSDTIQTNCWSMQGPKLVSKFIKSSIKCYATNSTFNMLLHRNERSEGNSFSISMLFYVNSIVVENPRLQEMNILLDV